MKKKWTTPIDSHTPTLCSIMDGKVFEKDEALKLHNEHLTRLKEEGYEPEICRCVLIYPV